MTCRVAVNMPKRDCGSLHDKPTTPEFHSKGISVDKKRSTELIGLFTGQLPGGRGHAEERVRVLSR